jgi:hypothetical protein
MGEFDSSERDCRRAETLQSEHRRTPLLDGAMMVDPMLFIVTPKKK